MATYKAVTTISMLHVTDCDAMWCGGLSMSVKMQEVHPGRQTCEVRAWTAAPWSMCSGHFITLTQLAVLSYCQLITQVLHSNNNGWRLSATALFGVVCVCTCENVCAWFGVSVCVCVRVSGWICWHVTASNFTYFMSIREQKGEKHNAVDLLKVECKKKQT